MAKPKKPAKKIGGPFLATAVFCESILEDTDKTISAIRIIDAVRIVIPPTAPPDTPSKASPVPVVQSMLLTFKTGDSPGKHMLKIVVQQPNFRRTKATEKEIVLTPQPNGGINV